MEKMITMIGRGKISISGASELARDAGQDGLIHEAVEALGTLGASGSSPSNCERDLARWLKHLFGFDLEPYEITLHLQVSFQTCSKFFCLSINTSFLGSPFGVNLVHQR